MKKEPLDMAPGLSWLDSMLKLVKEYGTWNIIKSSILLLMFAFMIRVYIDPSFLYDGYIEYQEKVHQNDVTIRQSLDYQAMAYTKACLWDYKADRAWLINYHNGTSDWTKGTMKFESCSLYTDSVCEYYKDFPLSWMPFTRYIEDNDIYIGNIDMIQEIDTKFYNDLKNQGIVYIACINVNEIGLTKKSLGIFGLSYKTEPNDNLKQILHDALIDIRANMRSLINNKK